VNESDSGFLGGFDVPGDVCREGPALLALFAVVIVESNGKDGEITFVNDLLCRLAGYEQEDLVGEPLDILIPEKSRRAHHLYRQGFMERPASRPMGPDREVVLLHKNGSELRVWVGLHPLDADNVCAVILPMDIGRSYGLGAQ
jgi:PAS domain S-box-containing protein